MNARDHSVEVEMKEVRQTRPARHLIGSAPIRNDNPAQERLERVKARRANRVHRARHYARANKN